MPRRPSKGNRSLRPRIYLAGPEVFHPDARTLGEAKGALCARSGFEGVFPLDAGLNLEGLPKAEQARRIYLADIGLMQSADLAICNLTPFRGVSMDSGTAFEAGFMAALGRPVLGYTNVAADYGERTRRLRTNPWPGPEADRPDMAIEDFDLSENLMIEVAIREAGGTVVRRAVSPGRELEDLSGFEICLEQAARLFADSIVAG